MDCADINQAIDRLTGQIKALKQQAAALSPESRPQIAEITLRIAELTRERGRIYSKRYIMDEDHRRKMNDKAKAYYEKNRDKILENNRAKYVPKPRAKSQKNVGGAYPSPPDSTDLVYDDMIKSGNSPN